MTCEQGPLGVPSGFTLVTVLTSVITTLVPQQRSKAIGSSKLHGLPHSTVLLEAQTRSGGVVSLIVTVCVQAAVLLQQSVADHLRVMYTVQGSAGSRLVEVVTPVMVMQQSVEGAS